jgi:hypothetical protein
VFEEELRNHRRHIETFTRQPEVLPPSDGWGPTTWSGIPDSNRRPSTFEQLEGALIFHEAQVSTGSYPSRDVSRCLVPTAGGGSRRATKPKTSSSLGSRSRFFVGSIISHARDADLVAVRGGSQPVSLRSSGRVAREAGVELLGRRPAAGAVAVPLAARALIALVNIAPFARRHNVVPI